MKKYVDEEQLNNYCTLEQVNEIITNAFSSLYGVPPDYTVLDYLYSDGVGQYINTGLFANQDTRIIIDIEPEDNGIDVWMFEGRTAATENRFGVYCQYTLTPNAWYSDYGTSRTIFENFAPTGRILIDANKNTVAINGIVVEHEYEAFQSTANLYLLCNNTMGTTKGYVQGKVYSCQIYNNGLPVRDFVPVRKKSTLEVGFYDRVNGVFYGNAGTGVFTAG